MHRRTWLTLAFAACATSTAKSFAQAVEQKFPDVVDVKVTPKGGGRFDIAVTMTSPYDTEKRYADAFRIVALDGAQLGIFVFSHDHAGEQPFTRALSDVPVPGGVKTIRVEGRDMVSGYGGRFMEVALPGR
jgi:hypothetical protein